MLPTAVHGRAAEASLSLPPSSLLESAARARSLVLRGLSTPALFRAALTGIPPLARDAWVDGVLGLGGPDGLADDGPALPSGCVPYLPCPVDALLRLTEGASVCASDVFVDIGSGVGRAGAIVHLLTGATVLGVEVQPALVAVARELAARLRLSALSFVEGDAGQLAIVGTAGSVFFLYCPFSGDRLVRLLASLASIARERPLRVCCVDLPLPPCPWLEPLPPLSLDLAIYRSLPPGAA